MCRFIIVIGNSNNASDIQSTDIIRQRLQYSSAHWKTAIDQPELYAACLGGGSIMDSAILLHDHRGAIFGRLYPSTSGCDAIPPTSLHSFSQVQSEDIVHSKGRSLISRYWGHYVAVLRHPERSSGQVIRAPASALACLHIQIGTLNVFFSHLEDCAALKLTALSINWDSITAQVVGGDYLTHETGINEINTLECGESVECTPTGCTKQVYWDPRHFLRDRRFSSFSEATRAIRHAVDYSVSAHAGEHSHILVNLSGGLDSSIILGSLQRAPHRPTLTALNYYSRGCGDERYYARCMARRANCRLVERRRNDRLDLRRFYDCNFTVRPVLNFSAPDVEARTIELARESSATAIFNGELGDNIFGSRPGFGALVECIRENGFGRASLSAVMEYAMLTKRSIWRTLALTRLEYRNVRTGVDFNALRKMQRRYGLDEARSLMLASAGAEQHYGDMVERFLHPWLKDARVLAPGSDRLLFGLVAVTSPSYHSPFAHPDDPPQVSPLISQPLAEVALRIPAYMHCRFAQDRAVARAAFTDVLPTEILNRGLGKGGPDLWAKDVVGNNSDFLKDFLLDGILVKRGLVDRVKLEAALSPRNIRSTAIVGDVFAKLYIEAWLYKFQQRERSIA